MEKVSTPWLQDDSQSWKKYATFFECIDKDIEGILSSISTRYRQDFPGTTEQEITRIAINLVVSRTLVKQRNHATDGYKAMINNLFLLDPILQKIRDEMRKEFRFRYLISFLVGATTMAWLVYWLMQMSS